MKPIVSVITPASRGVKELSCLLNDFQNQTFKNFEHIIVYDGNPSEDIINLMRTAGPWTHFCNIKKDLGNMDQAPGTNPRNHGIKLSQGEYIVFCDDDDRYRDTYLETLISRCSNNSISVIQMSCQQSRMYKNGNPNKTILIPEIDLHIFPVICHVGTPCYMFPRKWALQEPWKHEPEHDYRFIKRICDKFKPTIHISGGMQVDVDGLILKGMKDWVSIPPFYRD